MLKDDLSGGQEAYKIPVFCELTPTEAEVNSLEQFEYLTRNKLTVKEHEEGMPDLDNNITLAEALNPPERAADSRSINNSGSEEAGENAELRRTLDRGIRVQLRVALTARKGFGVFAAAPIKEGQW